MRKAARAMAVLTLAAAAPALAATAERGPVPPCAGEAFPAPAALDAPLNVRVWVPPAEADEGRWTPPACLGWTGESYSALVASAGRFRQAKASEVLARIGAISHMTAIRYWSVTRGHWRQLFTDAAALSDADPDSRRADFAPDELVPGRALHFLQEENEPTRPVVYRLEVRERGPDRIVFTLANVTPIALAILTLAEPGGYEFVYVLEREQGEVWRYYSLYRARIRLNLLPRRMEASMTNRAGAIFRYLAGIPTDREPPPARYSRSPS